MRAMPRFFVRHRWLLTTLLASMVFAAVCAKLNTSGNLVVAGATSGQDPSAELNRVFFKELEVVGSTMGTLEELRRLVSLVDLTGIRPRIDQVLPLAEVAEGIRALAAGDVLGKIVINP